MIWPAYEHHRLAEQRVQHDAPRRLISACGQGDVYRPVADRVHKPLRSGIGLAQLDDHAGVTFADVGQDTSEVNPTGMQGASQRDSATDLARDGGDFLPGGLDRVDNALGGRLQHSSLFGQGYRSHSAVEQRYPEILLQARDSA